MKTKLFLFSGFLLVVFAFSFWQKAFLKGLIKVFLGKKEVISSLNKASSIPAVLGEVKTLEVNFDFGEIKEERGILAQGVFVYDLTNKKIIFQKNPHLKLPSASTIKIVTAAIALDKGKLEEELTVNYFPTFVGESSMNLSFGEKFTLEELLYGLLMVSGNDAAETIAQGIGGKRETFVKWMNEFAKKIGAKNTNFTTPSGLDEEGQYTTAYDLFLLGSYIFNHYPKILEISTTKEKYLPQNDKHKAYFLRNKFLLLDQFPILAAKPGLGEGGMLSLVALLEKEKRKILVVLIRTPSLRHDLDKILNLL
ncbi:MAG: D-alanyl-D-alanine carboxypeptidase family protein [Microgenomates group bacterium]